MFSELLLRILYPFTTLTLTPTISALLKDDVNKIPPLADEDKTPMSSNLSMDDLELQMFTYFMLMINESLVEERKIRQQIMIVDYPDSQSLQSASLQSSTQKQRLPKSAVSAATTTITSASQPNGNIPSAVPDVIMQSVVDSLRQRPRDQQKTTDDRIEQYGTEDHRFVQVSTECSLLKVHSDQKKEIYSFKLFHNMASEKDPAPVEALRIVLFYVANPDKDEQREEAFLKQRTNTFAFIAKVSLRVNASTSWNIPLTDNTGNKYVKFSRSSKANYQLNSNWLQPVNEFARRKLETILEHYNSVSGFITVSQKRPLNSFNPDSKAIVNLAIPLNDRHLSSRKPFQYDNDSSKSRSHGDDGSSTRRSRRSGPAKKFTDTLTPSLTLLYNGCALKTFTWNFQDPHIQQTLSQVDSLRRVFEQNGSGHPVGSYSLSFCVSTIRTSCFAGKRWSTASSTYKHFSSRSRRQDSKKDYDDDGRNDPETDKYSIPHQGRSYSLQNYLQSYLKREERKSAFVPSGCCYADELRDVAVTFSNNRVHYLPNAIAESCSCY